MLPVSALSAGYQVLPNGTAYRASIDVQDAKSYEFSDIGVMGQWVPLPVTDVRLTGAACDNCSFNWTGSSAIAFENGSYTVSFMAPLHESHFQAAYARQYNVNITLPQGFDVRNPFLGTLSPQGANVTRYPDNTTTIRWDNATYFDVRFYDQAREDLLFLFGAIWIAIAAALLVPFLITMQKKE